ncbi:MAG: hypothetical protein GY749_27420 [Desulfobacteraceae bacterium]|nr:hypothetical protein [Desulfobacteraceae bacterium]
MENKKQEFLEMLKSPEAREIITEIIRAADKDIIVSEAVEKMKSLIQRGLSENP